MRPSITFYSTSLPSKFPTGNEMSLVIAFALKFSKTRELLIFSCCCTISIFVINYTEAQKAHCKAWLYVPLSVGLPAIILILTINQIHDGLLKCIVGACNTRQSVVTSLTSMSTCIICWWKTYLDCMNNNILSLTLCCDTHFIYWPQLDFCIDFTATVCLWRFSMDFPAAIPTDPTWSLSEWPHRGKGMENSHHFHHLNIPGSCLVHPSNSRLYSDSKYVSLTRENMY